MKRVYLSLIVLEGIPNMHTQREKKKLATHKAENVPFIGINMQNLLKWSIMLKIVSKPDDVSGK